MTKSHELATDLRDRLRMRFADFPLTRGWGLDIASVAWGEAVLALEPTPATTNGASGVVNGGVLATLADMACALALCTHFDGRMPFATSDLHIRYLEPVQDRVEFRAAVVRASARSAVIECRALCGIKVMAQATASFTIRNRPAEAP